MKARTGCRATPRTEADAFMTRRSQMEGRSRRSPHDRSLALKALGRTTCGAGSRGHSPEEQLRKPTRLWAPTQTAATGSWKVSWSGTSPAAPTTADVGSTSTIGNRQRASASASALRVCAFSLTRCASICFCQLSRSTIGGVAVMLVSFDAYQVTFRMRIGGPWSGPSDQGEAGKPPGRYPHEA
jgi:hypothetical protein